MPHRERIDPFLSLDAWFKSAQGSLVAQAFTDELKSTSHLKSGSYLLQLGLGGDNIWLPALNYRHHWIATPASTHKKNTLLSDIHALPFEKNSIDCIIAPLTIEALMHGKLPIDEIDRILKPMGLIIILGINPISLWGLALSLGCTPCFGARTIIPASSLTLKQQFLNRGYTQMLLSSFYHLPPLKNPKLIKNLAFLNPMGKMLWPLPGGFYCFIAQKYQPIPPAGLMQRLSDYLGLSGALGQEKIPACSKSFKL